MHEIDIVRKGAVQLQWLNTAGPTGRDILAPETPHGMDLLIR